MFKISSRLDLGKGKKQCRKPQCANLQIYIMAPQKGEMFGSGGQIFARQIVYTYFMYV